VGLSSGFRSVAHFSLSGTPFANSLVDAPTLPGGLAVLSIHRILHPTDYSEHSRPAFEMACALARDLGAELIICHVSPPSLTALENGVVVQIPTGESEQMEARLIRVKPEIPGLQVIHQLLRGDAAAEIVRFAADARIDLIVIGTHGRGGLVRLLMGSVAEHVLRNAPCPVVTVKAQTAASS
jgi:nucleotide-binding universal stress UspA family protein